MNKIKPLQFRFVLLVGWITLALASNTRAQLAGQVPAGTAVDSQHDGRQTSANALMFDRYATIDILEHDVSFRVNVPKATIEVESTMVFSQAVRAVPLFDLKPNVKSMKLDSIVLDTARIGFVSPPDGTANFVDIGLELEAGIHTLHSCYDLNAENTPRCRFECSVIPTGKTRTLTPAIHSFENGRQLDFLMAVMDYAPATYRTDGRTFLERYIPSGQESDLHRLSINVELTGSDVPHRIIANGRVDGLRVEFPEHTSCSSAYFHLIPVPRYFVSEQTLDVANQTIDVTVYSTVAAGEEFHQKSVSNVVAGVEERALEIGFYPNESFIAHLYPKAGGMEYTGATSCAPSALRHEITHSWFGRGMRPRSGADGWIDEAITTWWVDRRGRFDATPPSFEELSKKRFRKLSFESRYFRMTPSASYRQGAECIAYLASVYSHGGRDLKAVLIDFAEENMHRAVSTEQFLNYVISRAPETDELEQAMRLFVYGSPDESK